jgi:tetratricopeptide (TPR) repeat protein
MVRAANKTSRNANRHCFKMLLVQALILSASGLNFTQSAFAQTYTMSKTEIDYETRLAKNLAARGNHIGSRRHLLRVICSPLGQTADNYFWIAESYTDEDKSNHRFAKIYLSEATRVDPEFGPAYRLFAYLAQDEDKYQDAIRMATKAITCKSPDKTAFLWRSHAYQYLHNTNAALADAIEFFKFCKQIHLGITYMDYDYLANLQISVGKIDDAIKTYESAMPLRGDWATIQIAHCRDLQHKYSEAIALVSGLIKKNPRDDDAYHIRAQLYFKDKNYKGAVADLTQAITLVPTSSYYKERA